MKNKERIVSAISFAVSETIENMAFSEVVPQDTEEAFPLLSDGDCMVSLPLYSPVKGALILALPGGLLESLVENIYGNEKNGNGIAMDTMAEILNTTAGRFMSRLTDPDQQFSMGLPAAGKDSSPAGSSALTCVFAVEGYRMTVTYAGSI